MADDAKITVEDMKKEDIDEVVALGLTTKELHLQEEKALYYPKHVLSSFIKSPNDIYLVAKVDDVFAGYRLATYNPYLGEAYLLDLVVKPEFRGLGVATKLYEKTFEILNNKGCFWAWTLAKSSNPKIVKILKKKGFRVGASFTALFKEGPF